jgi:hypothetical protein
MTPSVIGKSDEEIAEHLDIDVEEIEDDLVNEEEAEEEMRGETDTVSESQIELMGVLADLVAECHQGGFGNVVQDDHLSDEEIMKCMRSVQIAVWGDLKKEVYVGITDVGPVMTTDIAKMSEGLEMSEYELEQQLEGFEGDL